jgi:hypothetical protein
MVKVLGLSKADASALKALMEDGYVHRVLDLANKVLDGFGREYLTPLGGGNGVDYVNRGDTYDTTLMFDYEKGRFVVSSWGDIVERQPLRFAD